MKIVDINSIAPSTYNPRISDPERLDLIELSLKKLGFVLPIYATNNGEIISGHQRHMVAKRMGLTKVPVEFISKNMDLQTRKNINICFNLGTNDVKSYINGTQLKNKIKEYNVFKDADNLPNKDLENDKEIFPCAFQQQVNLKKLTDKNYTKFKTDLLQKTKDLNLFVKMMPIIIDKEYNVINGIGRLHYLSMEKNKAETYGCIIIEDELKDFANYMLNYITMDFNIQDKYRDELRYNSHKREDSKYDRVGNGFFVKLSKQNPGKIWTSSFIKKFKKEYGNYILDFGAGHLRNTYILNSNGIPCIPFEPFLLGFEEFDKLSYEKSRQCCDEFLDSFHKKDDFTTIFLHSVFNSVPFEEDRKKILTILTEIATDNTKTIIWTRHISGLKGMVQGTANDHRNTRYKATLMNYEKNTILGNVLRAPKVQKFMNERDLIGLCRPYFKNIRTKVVGDMIYCECTNPINQPIDKIEEALDFEFNLKHPNGKCLGLNEKAKKIFKEVRERRGNNARQKYK